MLLRELMILHVNSMVRLQLMGKIIILNISNYINPLTTSVTHHIETS